MDQGCSKGRACGLHPPVSALESLGGAPRTTGGEEDLEEDLGVGTTNAVFTRAQDWQPKCSEQRALQSLRLPKALAVMPLLCTSKVDHHTIILLLIFIFNKRTGDTFAETFD